MDGTDIIIAWMFDVAVKKTYLIQNMLQIPSVAQENKIQLYYFYMTDEWMINAKAYSVLVPL